MHKSTRIGLERYRALRSERTQSRPRNVKPGRLLRSTKEGTDACPHRVRRCTRILAEISEGIGKVLARVLSDGIRRLMMGSAIDLEAILIVGVRLLSNG